MKYGSLKDYLIAYAIIFTFIVGLFLLMTNIENGVEQSIQITPTPTQKEIIVGAPIESVIPKPQIKATSTSETSPSPSPTLILISSPTPSPIPTPVFIISQPAPTPEPTQTSMPQPIKSVYTLEVVSPVPIKGLGREYLWRSQVKDEYNYIHIGLIVRLDGEPVKDQEVEIEATDPSQSQTLNGTGDVYPVYVNGVKVVTPFYPFNYEFRSGGDHQITFSTHGIRTTVNFLNVAEDTRP